MLGVDDLTKLKRDVVEKAVDDRGEMIGVTVKDVDVRSALGLEDGDVITAINGRAIKREFDVYDAVIGMGTMNASYLYLEVVRGKDATLVRWKLEGDLGKAKSGPIRRPPSPTTNPFTAPPDPLVDTITKIDALHYEVPRATVDQLLANPDQYARQARIVPAVRNGQPDGFKLYAIATGSLWFAIGFVNGDTIRSVNGHDLSTPDKALELYQKLKTATALRIVVGRRGGSEETIVITIK
jgi:type II secretory pathway component PulC